jgi:hypothetical protein
MSQNNRPANITGGSKLGLDVLKAQNPQYAEQLNYMARIPEGRKSIIAVILDKLRNNITQMSIDIQWSILGFTGPGWIVLCVSGIDTPCPSDAKEFIVNMFKSYVQYMPDVANMLLNEITRIVHGGGTEIPVQSADQAEANKNSDDRQQ